MTYVNCRLTSGVRCNIRSWSVHTFHQRYDRLRGWRITLMSCKTRAKRHASCTPRWIENRCNCFSYIIADSVALRPSYADSKADMELHCHTYSRMTSFARSVIKYKYNHTVIPALPTSVSSHPASDGKTIVEKISTWFAMRWWFFSCTLLSDWSVYIRYYFYSNIIQVTIRLWKIHAQLKRLLNI